MADGADENRFDDLATAHVAAVGVAPPDLTADLLLAGEMIRVRVAGRSLARLFHRAVSHLVLRPRESVTSPEISIYLSEPNDTAAVRVLREIGDGLPRAWTAPDLEIRSSACGRMLGFAFGRRSRFVLDRKNRILAGVQEPERLVLFERTKPLLLPLRVLLQDRGIHVAHAGLVATGDVGVLIAGPEGAGKTSAALKCFMAGFDFLGDDQIALVSSNGALAGHSLYNAVQVQPEWLPQLTSLPPRVLDRDSVEGKIGVFLSEVAPGRLRRSVPVRALVLPRLGPNRPTGVVPASKADALMRIAPSTLFQPLGAGTNGLRVLRRLVESVPSYWLDPGEDASSIPASVRQVLRTLRQL